MKATLFASCFGFKLSRAIHVAFIREPIIEIYRMSIRYDWQVIQWMRDDSWYDCI